MDSTEKWMEVGSQVNIDHTKTKVKHPQTNGICKRFHKTILQEFYQVTFRKNLYEMLEQLQTDLDGWMHHYNTQRTHQGKICCPSQRYKYRLQGSGKNTLRDYD